MGARPPRPIATTTDGLQTFRWPQGWHNTNLAWLPDSRGWLRTMHLGFNPSVQTYLLGSRREHYTPMAAGTGGWPLGVTPRGHLVGIGGNNLSIVDTGEPRRAPNNVALPPEAMPLTISSPLTLTERDPIGAAAPRNFPMRFPTRIGGGDASVALSPDGERVGWLVYTPRPFPPLTQVKVLTRLLLRLPISEPSSSTLNLFVSKRDGTGMREVGRVAVSPRDRSRGVLKWTPDGTRLSFVFEDALWTVPAR